MEECKKCLLLEAAEEGAFKSIAERIEKLPESEKADKELYSLRLEKCKNCDNLISGMCLKCGCYVEFRAAFKRKKCPNVNNPQW